MPETPQPALILNVDDDRTGRSAVTRMLERAGHTVQEAGTANEGLLLASRAPVDLVILDVNLPDIDGLEVARRLHSDPATSSIPILHLSSSAVEESDLATVADAYLREPVSEQVLLAYVRTLLQMKRTQQALRESEARYQILLETAADFIWEMDAQGRYTYCSPQMEQLWGIKPGEMLGKTPFDVMPAEEAERARKQFAMVANSPGPLRGLATCAHDAAGRLIFLETSGMPLFDARGRLLGFRGITRDVTEQKRMEEALRESEARRTQALIDAADESIWLFDVEGTILAANATSARRTGGLSVADVVGRKWYEVAPPEAMPPAVLERRRKMADEVIRTGAPVHFEDARLGRALQHSLYPVRDEEGTVTAVAAFSRDITERERAGRALRESEERYRALFEMLPVPVFLHHGRALTLVNAAGAAMLRLPDASVVIGQEISHYVAPGSQEEVDAHVWDERICGPDAPDHLFTTLRRSDGEEFPAEVFAADVHHQGRRLTQTVVFDVTERLRAESALRESEEKFRALFAMLPVSALIHEDGRLRLINPACAATFRVPGTDSVVGEHVMRFVAEEGKGAVEQRLRVERRGGPEAPDHYAAVLRRADGEEFPAEIFATDTVYQGRPATQLVVFDVTERVRSEQALRESEERYRLLFESMQEGFFLTEVTCDESGRVTGGRFIDANPALQSLTGLTRQDLLGRSVREVLPAMEAHWVEAIRQVALTGKPMRREGSAAALGRHYSVAAYSPRPGQVAAFLTDITDRKQAEEEREGMHEQLLAAERSRAELAERLNREIAHRTKNNLAMAAGLLRLQAAQHQSPEVDMALAQTMSRLMTFASIQEEMQVGGSGSVDLLPALQRIASASCGAFAGADVAVSVSGESLALPAKIATSLAVAANELITNAIKHGTPGPDGKLSVEVALQPQGDSLRLCVWNSGDPVAEGGDPTTQRGMGLRLVTELAVEQCEGSFALRPEAGGTIAEVIVPLPAPEAPAA